MTQRLRRMTGPGGLSTNRVLRAYRKTKLHPAKDTWFRLVFDEATATWDEDANEGAGAYITDDVVPCGCGLTAIACELRPELLSEFMTQARYEHGLEGGKRVGVDYEGAVLRTLEEAGFGGVVMSGFVAGFDGTYGDDPSDKLDDAFFSDDDDMVWFDLEMTAEHKGKGRYVSKAEARRLCDIYHTAYLIGRDAWRSAPGKVG